MKEIIKKIFVVIVLLVILILCSLYLKDNKKEKNSKILDVTKDILIDDKYLKVTYSSGNMIDTHISFNNTLEKNIKVINFNDSLISYSLEMYDSSFSNEDVIYSIEASNEYNGKYQEVVKDIPIKGNQSLGYNLAVDPNSTIYLKVIFKSLYQNGDTNIKGILNIKSNLTEKDIFIKEVLNIDNELKNRIEKLNGISVPGNYIEDISNMNLNNNIKGFILINAEDISSIEYYYSVYSDKYMLKDYNLINSLSKNSVLDIDQGYIYNLNLNTVCKNRGKKNCLNFNSLSYNTAGGKKEFDEDAKKVINLVKEDFKETEKNIYVYNVSTCINNPTNVRGYILIDNTKDNPEYYIYLTNNMFMISGYNVTKLGDFTADSSTIRAYNESAFNLSSENESKVCSFSGFSYCINK